MCVYLNIKICSINYIQIYDYFNYYKTLYVLIHYYIFSVHVHTYVEEMFGRDEGYRKEKLTRKCKNNIRNINSTKEHARKEE